MRKLAAFALTCLLPLAACQAPDSPQLASQHQAATLQVPGQYATIQAAVLAAAPGDLIQVAPGTYNEVVGISIPLTVSGQPDDPALIRGRFHLTAGADGARLAHLVLQGPSDGPGVWIEDTRGELDHLSLSGYSTAVTVALDGSFGSWATACTVVGNNKGVLVTASGNLRMDNSLLLASSAEGITVTGSASAELANLTVVANGDEGLWLDGPTTLINTISVNNRVGLTCRGNCVADHNLIWGNQIDYEGQIPGANDLSADPRFVDPVEHDFHLQPDSPAIDAGTASGAPDVDLAGTARPQGDGFDLGAYEIPPANQGTQLIINEVMANPEVESSGEYVELLNLSGQSIDAAGLILSDGDSTDVLAAYAGGGTIIPPNGLALVLDPDYAGQYDPLPAEAILLSIASTVTLGNGLSVSDPISLWEADGQTIIDRYSHPFDPGNGISIERISAEEGDIPVNFIASPCGSSPGLDNCASGDGPGPASIKLVINEVMANPLVEASGEFIELLNMDDQAIDLDGFVLSDGDSSDVLAGYQAGPTSLSPGAFAIVLDPDYAGDYDPLPPGALLLTTAIGATLGNGLSTTDPISLMDPSGTNLVASYSGPFDPGNGVSAERVNANLSDTPGNWTASPCPSGSSPGVANCATDGGLPGGLPTVIISEVMANAIDEDTGEYVELYNYGPAEVDLLGWSLSDGDQVDGIELFPEGGSDSVLQPGAYALVLDREYAGEYDLPAGTVLLTTTDTSIGSGLSTTDPLSLRDTEAQEVDTYSHPFNPGNGISAEKADLLMGDVAGNWVASPCGRSPGRPNCEAASPSADVSATRLVISEVMANPLDEGSGEYIELYNAGPGVVDALGYVLSDGDAVDVIAGHQGGSTLIPAGTYAVVLDQDYAGQYVLGAGAVLLTVGNGSLGNGLATNDPIQLFAEDGLTLVDSFSFPINPGNGFAIEKRIATGGDKQVNWATSPCLIASGADNDHASPGSPNCADDGGGITGDKVIGEPCPYGAVDCVSGLCLQNLHTYETYCTETCLPDACPTGFSCQGVEEAGGAGSLDVCVADTVCGIDVDLGSALGAPVAVGTTAGNPNEYTGSCGGSDASEAVFGWTAPAAGDYVFDTLGSSLATVLYALQGSCAGAEIACNDDTDGTPQSAISLSLDLGESVVLVIDSQAQQTGNYELNITSLDCPGADLGSPIGSTVIEDTTTGESNRFEGSCGGRDAPERTFAFVAPKPALYTFHTIGSSLASVIYLLDDTCNGTELACNDDFDGTPQSAVSVSLTQGQRIIVVVDGEDNLAGDFELTITYDLYEGLQGFSDGALIQALNGLVAEHAGLDYTGARLAMFSSIDNEGGEVECVYTGFRLKTDAIPDHTIMNTEHTWAQSWGADIWPARTDLHHLFPTTSVSNSVRASYYFGEVVSVNWSDGGSMRGLDAGGQIVFEPRDTHKGDLARALFYFSVRYLMEIPDGQEAVIRAWSNQDPPDQKELQRNDDVERTQHNRNPFIDHPEYLDQIIDF